MSSAADQVVPVAPSAAPDGEQRVVLYGVPWPTYCAVRELLDRPGLRMTYLKGTLEIMSPSSLHEDVKTRIARLIELFALERDVPLYGYGSTTFRREIGERGLEPDECYVLGGQLRDYPDIAIEVIVSSGMDKLEVYRGLGVREVWAWREGDMQVFILSASGYVSAEHSKLVPELDFKELAELAARPDQHMALKEYRARLRAR